MDVTRENFEELFPQIRKTIEDAAFIAIDGEFTGLSTSALYEPALYDTPDIRYEKLRKSMSNFTMCQCGISMFVPDKTIQNSYKAFTYNFFLTAPSFGPIDGRFLCQSSALEFLSNHNFDFNTFIKHGVSYMNKDQEKLCWQYHKDNAIQQHVSALILRQYDEKHINPALAKTNQLLEDDNKDETIEIDFNSKGLCQYLFLKALEKNYTNIGCVIKDDGKVMIKRLSEADDGRFNFEEQYETLVKHVVGFSSVIHLIAELKKPLVGHNMMRDLILIYNLFCYNLPDTYTKFKASVHKMFPSIYDTKHIMFTLRKEFRKVNFFESTCLEDAYDTLSSSDVQFYKLYNPQIDHAEEFTKYNVKAMHEAGYDAYLTGYIFIRLSHLKATKNIPSIESKPVEFDDYLKALIVMKNCVNMPRAAVRYIKFGGEDPPINHPQCFVVTLKTRSAVISANQVAQDFLPFGSVDVKLRSAVEALVAVSYRKKSSDIVRAFSRNKFYYVVPYNWWYHSDLSRSLIWYSSLGGSALIFVGIFGFLYNRVSTRP